MSEQKYEPTDRRPIASRELAPVQWLASALARSRVTANQISVAGMISAIIAALCFWLITITSSESPTLWLLAALFVQLRLLANVLDGMVAIAQNKASPLGELYNEVPDRISDTFILIGFGLAPGGSAILGCLAAIAAMLTAYIRAVGKAAGAGQQFCGPLAKPQRMFLVTVTAFICALTRPTAACANCTDSNSSSLGLVAFVLVVIFLGSLLTAARRLILIAKALTR